jgi:uncharacterized membrane protein (UPF0182 family)
MLKNNAKLVIFPIFIILLIIAFFVINLFPEVLWFASFGYKKIWWYIFNAKISVFCFFTIFAFFWLLINSKIAEHNAKKLKDETVTEQDIQSDSSIVNFLLNLIKNKNAVSPTPFPQKVNKIFVRISIIILAIFFGLAAKAKWEIIYLFLYQTPFNFTDPILHKDLSFYFFTLPALKNLYSWLLSLMVFSLVTSAWVYLSHNILKLVIKNKFNLIKTHLFMLLASFVLIYAFGFSIKIYDLLFSTRGVIFGAGYTDIYAQMVGLKILSIALLVFALILFVWAFKPGVKIPVYAFLTIIILSFVLLQIYPGIIQNYIVAPNEMEKEKPFIDHSINYTRKAFGLDKIEEEEFDNQYNFDKNTIKNNQTIINNIRLWNQAPLKQTFSQLQEIRLYYEFANIDVDRYKINNMLKQVMLSPRELNTSQLTNQAQTWINKHLVYTHGYGVCMAPVNIISQEGLPTFYLKDLPPKSSIAEISVNQPEIYFGEKTADYVIVNTKQEEFDYPKGDDNVYTNYAGQGGIQLDSFIKRIVFALKYSDLKILISSRIKAESRLLFNRRITTIVRKICPFLIFDRDPYLILTSEGRMVWMLDGYTISNRFPYSEPLRNGINYIRNSVKVTIDAYNGDANFYISDATDPIILTYAKIFKDLFKPFEEMPLTIKEHIRYPKDLFTIQASVYSTFHMTDSQVFYNKEDLWALPQETYIESEQTMQPYYMVTKLPNDQKESFILMLPFTPTNKNNMIAWLSAKCDLNEYGKLKVYKFPKQKTVYGPMQIESRIDQNTEISQKLTLWGQKGSRVIRGNLMVIPIEQSLIYVEPIYLQATQSKLPELKRVIFAYHDSIVMADNLPNAIEKMFDFQDLKLTADQRNVEKPPASDGNSEKMPDTLHQLIQEYEDMKQKVQNFDWLEFGQKMAKIEQLLKQLKK